ncbi:hypothetical protein MMC13_003888 [Lambiella insularis]|nr:hypothetical protein [Lambiella insularis]
MLACELDLPIGINAPLTVLSSVLAVAFTFAALASDLLWDRYNRKRRGNHWLSRRARRNASLNRSDRSTREYSSKPLLDPCAQDIENLSDFTDEPETPSHSGDLPLELDENEALSPGTQTESPRSAKFLVNGDLAKRPSGLPLNGPFIGTATKSRSPSPGPHAEPIISDAHAASATDFPEWLSRKSSDHSISRRSSSFTGSTAGSYGLGSIMNLAYRSTSPAKNAFIATGEALYFGCSLSNILKGFLWSLAITSMHYVGITALRIPNGYSTADPFLVILSGLISWIVCLVGIILMAQMETHLTQQLLFSAVATTGVAAMHFTGMQATTFWSYARPSETRGYPPSLAIAIVSIAIATCITANGLLAHTATVSCNKLAEIVWTRRKLWRTIAQKENAEAAMLQRSEFIASASHEIRTPLHHLQGYSDLLSRTELTEEGRMLLCSIQRATKTLSLITNNVLDWSKLERDGEVCRPVALDIRTVCESILVLLPNKDDEAEVELMVAVAPSVPNSLFLDETYIHRILMNLLSNALKFTRSGYILLLIEMDNGKLVATVKDTGCGIPPSFLPQLFEPFKQAQTRGSQRGTGLGLSIIQQLLHKMGGTIEVQSKHPDMGEVELRQTGSTFTITIPTQASSTPQSESTTLRDASRIAIFHEGDERSVEAVRTAWQKCGFDVVMIKKFSDLSGFKLKYIWADSSYLRKYPALLDQLLEQDEWSVLVPYDTQTTLQELPGLLNATHFIPLPKPLVWHSFQERIAMASQSAHRAALGRSVRFASKVDIVSHNEKDRPAESTAKNLTILLVEDNPINLKLGKKMLTSLGYRVLMAEDGQDAIEQIVKHDSSVDAILMDQSMPRKDGVTATREIRALEANGTLLRTRPIIAVTAVVNSEAQAQFKSAGATTFLAKPLSLNKLDETLATYLRPE